LGQIEAVQARLAQDEIELRREIEALRAELKRDQDPNRMQLIQETISVCVILLLNEFMLDVPWFSGFTWSNVANPWEGDRVWSRSQEYHQGHSIPWSGKEESHLEHDNVEAIANVGHVDFGSYLSLS
jgi:hypothetical protein